METKCPSVVPLLRWAVRKRERERERAEGWLGVGSGCGGARELAILSCFLETSSDVPSVPSSVQNVRLSHILIS